MASKMTEMGLKPREYDTRTSLLAITLYHLDLLIALWKKQNQILPGSKLDSSVFCMDQLTS